MTDGNSIINLGDLAKPATTLIEKISDAAGVLYEPTRIRKKAKADADAEIIRAEAQIEITDLEQRGLQRLIVEEGRKQGNMEDIISKALPAVEDSATPENIDNDWMANFFDKCKNISDEEMQVLWSKILSGEANSPNRFSKRTINIVSDLGKPDANTFSTLCRYVWTIGAKKHPLVFDSGNTLYTNNEINFVTLTHLENLGLINFKSFFNHKLLFEGVQDFIAIYNNLPFILHPRNPETKAIPIGNVLLTNAGHELTSLCDVPPVDGFVEYVQQTMAKNGFDISRVPEASQ